MPRKAVPKRGDVIEIRWRDIFEDVIGSMDQAKTAARTTWGIFWAREERDGIDTLVTTTTLDEEDHHQQGWCAYPYGCITSVTVIKRAKR